jgi:tRNA modification GTPase
MIAPPRDTIAAISTAVGPGAIAVVRVSGDRAMEVAGTLFVGPALSECASHTVHYGRVVDEHGSDIDEVLATVLRAPHTYTTEDMIEFSCHGGPIAAGRVLEALLAAGARAARRGEFTERAFLGGRLDLVQAEAVADMVAARTPRGLEVALGQLEGELSKELSRLRDRLVDFRAQIESHIDFAEEDLPPRTVTTTAEAGRRGLAILERLLERCDLGVAVRDGVSVAIVGRPNVGKSSLMNALLMRERSIVTSVPGTTRDAIEEHVNLSGIAVRLIDTAGWWEADNEAEAAGVGRAQAAARGADLVLLVLDGSLPVSGEDREIAEALEPGRTVVVVNKLDLGHVPGEQDLPALRGAAGPGGRSAWPRVSALTGAGMGELRAALTERAVGGQSDEPVLVSNARHVAALRRCREALLEGLNLVERGAAPEIAAVAVAEATDALGEVTGQTTPEDVLRRIFERFCIGK